MSFKVQSTITIRQCKNDDYSGLFLEYGLTYEIPNNFGALENQNQQRQNYLEFCQTSHIPRTDQNRYFCTKIILDCTQCTFVHFELGPLFIVSTRRKVDFCSNIGKGQTRLRIEHDHSYALDQGAALQFQLPLAARKLTRFTEICLFWGLKF